LPVDVSFDMNFLFKYNCLQLIQQEWFHVSSQKEVNGHLVDGYLNSIKEHFSNFLLERIVNLQDANVRRIHRSQRIKHGLLTRFRAIRRYITVSLMDIGTLSTCS
jgi:hypothetical protein